VEITLNNRTPKAQDSADMIRVLAYTGMRIEKLAPAVYKELLQTEGHSCGREKSRTTIS